MAHRIRTIVVNQRHIWECTRCGRTWNPDQNPDTTPCGGLAMNITEAAAKASWHAEASRYAIVPLSDWDRVSDQAKADERLWARAAVAAALRTLVDNGWPTAFTLSGLADEIEGGGR